MGALLSGIFINKQDRCLWCIAHFVALSGCRSIQLHPEAFCCGPVDKAPWEPKINWANWSGDAWLREWTYLCRTGLAEDLESCLAEDGVFKAFCTLYSGYLSTENAVLRTWERRTQTHTVMVPHWIWLVLISMLMNVQRPSVRRSVTSSSRDGMILSNILNFFPKRGIWRMRQEGAWRWTPYSLISCRYTTTDYSHSLDISK